MPHIGEDGKTYLNEAEALAADITPEMDAFHLEWARQSALNSGFDPELVAQAFGGPGSPELVRRVAESMPMKPMPPEDLDIPGMSQQEGWMPDRYTIVAVVGAFILGCLVTFIATRPPGSYQRCMLDEMRGRPANHSSLADDYRQMRYPHPF